MVKSVTRRSLKLGVGGYGDRDESLGFGVKTCQKIKRARRHLAISHKSLTSFYAKVVMKV